MDEKSNLNVDNFCVVIPTLNRSDELVLTLKSICDSSITPKKLIIVDDGSVEDTKKNIKEIITANPNIQFMLVWGNSTGLTNARNIGTKYIGDSEIVFFLDDDVTLNKDYFEKIMLTFESNINIVGCQGFVSNSISNNNIISRFFIGIMSSVFPIKRSFFTPDVTKSMLNRYPLFVPLFDKVRSCDWLSGCNMAYKADLFNQFQFDENLIQYSLGEDIDFSYNLKIKGYKLVINFDAQLIHRFSTEYRRPKMSILLMEFGYMFYFIYKYTSHPKVAYFLCRYRSFYIFLLFFVYNLFRLHSTLFKDGLGSFKSYLDAYYYVRTFEGDISNGDLSQLNSNIQSFSRN